MDEKTTERIFAFETHMAASPSQLAREEIAAGKRWGLLQALAYIATGDMGLVEQVHKWCPHYNALPHHNAAQSASIHLTRELDRRRRETPLSLSLDEATRILLAGLRSGSLFAYVNAKPTLLTGLNFREITYRSDQAGLAPTPAGDSRYWQSVYVNADDVRRLRQADSSEAAIRQPVAANEVAPSKRSRPKEMWTSDEMAAEIRAWAEGRETQDRDAAWRDHFKDRYKEHGWSNESFRLIWADARGSAGKPGRRPKFT